MISRLRLVASCQPLDLPPLPHDLSYFHPLYGHIAARSSILILRKVPEQVHQLLTPKNQKFLLGTRGPQIGYFQGGKRSLYLSSSKWRVGGKTGTAPVGPHHGLRLTTRNTC